VPPSRVRRMPLPLASNPHRFHEDRSEIAHEHRPARQDHARRKLEVELSASEAAVPSPRAKSSTAGMCRCSAGGHSPSISGEGHVLERGETMVNDEVRKVDDASTKVIPR
jgi:hypothetical protein